MRSVPKHLCESISGVVLAGGKGRRIGGKKAFIQLSGQTLIERVCDRLAAIFSEVVIVADALSPFAHLPYRSIPDRLPELGPIGGLESALRAIPEKHLFVVACDMPKLSPDVIRAMLPFSLNYDLVVPRIAGRLHPLHAIYSPTCLAVVTAQIKKKDLALHSLSDHLNCFFFQEERFRQLDSELRSLININTLEDLASAQVLDRDINLSP